MGDTAKSVAGLMVPAYGAWRMIKGRGMFGIGEKKDKKHTVSAEDKAKADLEKDQKAGEMARAQSLLNPMKVTKKRQNALPTTLSGGY